MRISDALVPELDQEMATTRRVLDRCSEDKFGWKPHQKSFSMAALATHIANMLGWGVDTINKDSFDYAPVGAAPYKEEPVATHKELLERFDKNAAAFRAALVASDDEHLMKNWSLLGGGKPVFTMPRVAIIRAMIMNHIIHHRGQLSVYLRLNDIPVPSIYGPSADDPGGM